MTNQSKKIFYKYAFYFSNGTRSTPKMVTKLYHTDHMSARQEAVESRPGSSYYSLTLWALDSDDYISAPADFSHLLLIRGTNG